MAGLNTVRFPAFVSPLVAKVSLYVAYLALDTAIVCWRGHSIRSVTIAPIMKATSPCLKNVSQAGTGIYQRRRNIRTLPAKSNWRLLTWKRGGLGMKAEISGHCGIFPFKRLFKSPILITK